MSADHGLDGLSRERAGAALALMLKARRFEEAVGQLYAMGAIPGPAMLAIGQEAATVGLRLAMAAGDQLVAGQRCFAHAAAAGVDLADALAGLMSEARGRAGNGRIAAPAQRFWGGDPREGGPAARALGLALANRFRGDGAVAFAALGDLAAERGETSDALRLAREWKAPLVLVVEDHRADEGFAAALAGVGASFGVEGRTADGLDVATTIAAVARARAACAIGRGPALVVLGTARYRGHSMEAPTRHRRRGEDRRLRGGEDPIERLRQRLLALGVEEEELEEVDEAARGAVADAVAKAELTAGAEGVP
ncbi:MAG: pyruvate dehydrogenase (acetyl-transferring) E1 component subunit alpha [Rhizobiales bacterium]|nr:pyruvate dehydrogenase (acetyl-transferring) E1 component subunit alpha [Hyphomicrobiales bacterium]